MIKMKKFLAVLTASLLILTNIPSIVANAANDSLNTQYTDTDKTNFRFSYNFYRTIEVINDDLKIDSTIPRGVWADIIVRYFGCEAAIDASQDIRFFEDHDPKYDKMGAVNLAANLGLMGEYDDGKFCPDVDVSYEDVCISVLKGLGYEYLVDSRGGGVDQYLLLANELGLLKGVTGARGYPIVASAAVKILDNALKTEMLGKTMTNLDFYKKGGTVISDIHNLEMKDGVVTSDSRSSLYNSNKMRPGYIAIDNVIYNYSGSTDGLVGYRVRYFVDKTENDTVVYLDKLRNDVEVIDFDDVSRYENRTYYYNVDNSRTEKKWKIPKDCAVIYNGTAITDGFVSNLPMFTEDGSLTLIDNNLDGETDVLLIEAYVNLWIGHIDKINETVYSYYDEKDYISFGDYKTVELYDSYGAETTFAKLSLKNVLSVAKTPDGETVVIDICTDTAEGKVSGIDTDGTKTVFTINGIDYNVSSICDTSDVSLGFSGVFYLNKKRQIVGYDEKLAVPVGYMVGARKDKGIGENVLLRVLTSSGELKTFNCAEKVKVTGKPGLYTNEDLYTLLLNGGTEVKPQAILYELNKDGDISSLDLIGHSDRIREMTTLKSSSIQYRTSASCFTDGKTFLNGGAIIFTVPMKGGSSDDYGVLSKSDLQDERDYSSDTLPAYSYQIDGSQLGVDVLVVDSSFRSRKYGMGIVKSIVQNMDENYEMYYKIEIYQYSNLNTYYMYNDDFDINNINAASSAFAARPLEVGDVVGLDYIPDSGKKILTRVSIIYDISNDEYLYSNPSLTNHTSVTRYFFGDVQTKDNKLMAVVLRGGTMISAEETSVGAGVDKTAANYEIHPISGTVYVYDSKRKKDNVVKGSANDIAAYDTVGNEYSTIWSFTSKEATQMIYIVNK